MSGTLTVTVGSARNFNEGDTKGQVFVNLWVDDFKKLSRKTSHKDSSDPKWEQSFQIPLATISTVPVLHVELYDSHDDTILGKDTIKLASIIKNSGKESTKWYKLEPNGEIELKIVWQNEGSSKKEKRRSGEVSSRTGVVKKGANMTDRKAKAQSTKFSANTLREKGEKPKKPIFTRNKTDLFSTVSEPALASSRDAEQPNGERKYLPPPNVTVQKKNENEVLPEAWNFERKFLLMLLESRFLLREMLEFKLDTYSPDAKPKVIGSAVELRKLIAIYPDDEEDDTDLTAQIAELRKQVVIQIRSNQQVERELAVNEKKSALLIMNRSSIAELDRNAKKKKKKVDDGTVDNNNAILNDAQKLGLYENLFYMLQTQPKYLAKLTRVIPNQKMDAFIETIIMTLFGDAFSPREEFLLLTLLKLAIHQEIQHLKDIGDLIQVDSVVPKMIIAYNKRKQGKEYLVKTLSQPVTAVMDNVYDFSSEVDMEKALDSFLDSILDSIDTIPYGLRLILKQITEFMRIKFAQITEENLVQIYGFYFYFKFLNPCIIDPSETGILTETQVDMNAISNLAKIGKILQALFDNRMGKGGEEAKFNGWIKHKSKKIMEFFRMLIDVKPPEDELQIDRYTELYSKQQPIIIIRLREIVEMHELIKENVKQVIGDDENDPIYKIIKDLGNDIPHISETNTTDMQLTLKNKFGSRFEQELSDLAELFDATKELIIKVFRVTPIDQAASPNLLDILEFSKTYAKQNSNKKLEKHAEEALENVIKLEKSSFITSDDNYDAFLKAVAAELSNRTLRREQQQNEIKKLRKALTELQNHHKFVQQRITDMELYLESCRKKLAKKLKSKDKPIKFSYKQLLKDGVIAESQVPESFQSKTTFLISMPEIGIFQVEAKMGPTTEKMKLELEILLEKKDNGDATLELDKVTLNVTPTIMLMNKYFLR